MPPLAWQWRRRISVSPKSTVPLDLPAELWRSDPGFESWDGIVAAYKRAGRDASDERIHFDATQTLLLDVVDAAGGVEHAVMRLRGAVSSADVAKDRWLEGHPQPLPGDFGWSGPDTEEAWYALEDALVWARTLDDRLKRPAASRETYQDQGLIPALADGPRRNAVIAARSRLLQSEFGEARHLAGLNLHMQSTQAFKAGVIRSGRVVLRFPDRVTVRISHRWELTYDDGRDAVAFADDLLGAVGGFMDEMITALETHVPDRFERR